MKGYSHPIHPHFSTDGNCIFASCTTLTILAIAGLASATCLAIHGLIARCLSPSGKNNQLTLAS